MAPAFFDLSARTKLRVTGADRIRFLNGQTTNDVRKAGAEATQESCVLNAKGHFDAHVFLSATPNDIWIDADQELRELLQTRLERYVIADAVTIEDVTNQFALFHVLAESEPKISDAKFYFRSRRLGIDGWDLWVEVARAEATKSALAADYRAMDESEWEVLRIENGIPRWGRELTPEIIPPEANLAARAIDYEKGWTRNERRFFRANECAHCASDDKTRLYRHRHIVDRVGGRHGNKRQTCQAAVRGPSSH